MVLPETSLYALTIVRDVFFGGGPPNVLRRSKNDSCPEGRLKVCREANRAAPYRLQMRTLCPSHVYCLLR